MKVDLSHFVNKNEVVAVAVSGGSDSMALLHFLFKQSKKLLFNVIALNVEHGIRGKQSLKDSLFVENYCKQNNIPLLSYSVDCKKYAKERKLSLEQAGRELRYECFFNAINSGKCNKVATAHHLRDNAESVLLNIFRGTGVKGATGIENVFENKIIRPFLSVSKEEILDYIKQNDIPFVDDESNFSLDYTRNFIRLEVLPLIKKAFPEVEKSISRFSSILKEEDDFLQKSAINSVSFINNTAIFTLPVEKVIFSRACIYALKKLGLKKDWQKKHLDAIYSLKDKENGSKINLIGGFIAFKEYDKIVLLKEKISNFTEIPFSVGSFDFNGIKLSATRVNGKVDLKNGLFLDLNKVPKGAVIRTRKNGDTFTKFGGGTKKLNDYFTDVKLPLRKRSSYPLLCYGKKVLAIFGIAISNDVKIDENPDIIKLNMDGSNEKL